MMTVINPRSPLVRARTFSIVVAVATALSGCVSPAQQSVANTQQDQSVCTAMGASYGSAAHTQCMLQQQQRRDQEQLTILKQTQIGYETAQTAQEMRDSASD